MEPLSLAVADAGEVLTLQRAAYVREAQAHGDLALPPLTQTFDELRAELSDPWHQPDRVDLVHGELFRAVNGGRTTRSGREGRARPWVGTC